MTHDEAERLSDTYRRRGKKVLVVRSDFLGDGYCVYVHLPESERTPKPSRTYQQKFWV
ncbi:TPA: hypothetical protein JQ428_001421 [Shigella sonnei]|nr:hypothetical protein [Shigella sonnei]HDS7339894.1 hypothetical protein [Escherichia coli]EFZ2756034.1 hypothetical protein [Shigella sonnei]HAY7158735.1 hypothetical protein [Shigella sonnei]HAY7799688.1 hypothetical protein [Shigella sonnei]